MSCFCRFFLKRCRGACSKGWSANSTLTVTNHQQHVVYAQHNETAASLRLEVLRGKRSARKFNLKSFWCNLLRFYCWALWSEKIDFLCSSCARHLLQTCAKAHETTLASIKFVKNLTCRWKSVKVVSRALPHQATGAKFPGAVGAIKQRTTAYPVKFWIIQSPPPPFSSVACLT